MGGVDLPRVERAASDTVTAGTANNETSSCTQRTSSRYFPYGEAEMDYLRGKDAKLGAVIDALGHVNREMDGDPFSAVCHHIVAQQISNAALATVWGRLLEAAGLETAHGTDAGTVGAHIDAPTILALGPERLQGCGMTFRKAEYITDFARKVDSGAFDLEAVCTLPDEEAIQAFVTLRGIGRWTAEMILLFSLARPNIFAFDDLAIQRGMRMVYHHRAITRQLFEKYRRRLSPYCSVASIYFWAVAAGAVPGMKDYAPKKRGT